MLLRAYFSSVMHSSIWKHHMDVLTRSKAWFSPGVAFNHQTASHMPGSFRFLLRFSCLIITLQLLNLLIKVLCKMSLFASWITIKIWIKTYTRKICMYWRELQWLGWWQVGLPTSKISSPKTDRKKYQWT